MKYLKKFENEEEKTAWRMSEDHVRPNVVLTGETVEYDIKRLIEGFSIQHVDGNLYSKEQWVERGFSNDEANGIAYYVSGHGFVVAKEDIGTNTAYTWGGKGIDIEGIGSGINDWDGEGNTKKIVSQLSKSLTGDNYAAELASKYTFPNGAKGYLPSMQELYRAQGAQELLSLVGGTPFSGGGTSTKHRYWSSTEGDADTAYIISRAYSTIRETYDKSLGAKVRPFTKL